MAPDADAKPEEKGALADAKQFLQTTLENGPLPTKQIKTEATRAGHSWATVKRSKNSLGVKAFHSPDMDRGFWSWRIEPKVLINDEDAHTN